MEWSLKHAVFIISYIYQRINANTAILCLKVYQ